MKKKKIHIYIYPGYLGTKESTRKMLTSFVFDNNHINSISLLNSMSKMNAHKYNDELIKDGFNNYVFKRIHNDDHRKMIFLTTHNECLNSICTQYSSPIVCGTGTRFCLSPNNLDSYLNEVEVHAIVIGSSNFSKTTYMDNVKDEADLTLFKSGDIKDRILEKFLTEKDTRNQGMVLSESLNEVSDTYLNEIFKDTIS